MTSGKHTNQIPLALVLCIAGIGAVVSLGDRFGGLLKKRSDPLETLAKCDECEGLERVRPLAQQAVGGPDAAIGKPDRANDDNSPVPIERTPDEPVVIHPIRAETVVSTNENEPLTKDSMRPLAVPPISDVEKKQPGSGTRYVFPPANSPPAYTAIGPSGSFGVVSQVNAVDSAETLPVLPLANSNPPPQVPDLARATQFTLAEQPRADEHFHRVPPELDCRAVAVPPGQNDFLPDLAWDPTHDPAADMAVYNEKQCQPTQRPAVEFFRPWYQRGQLPESRNWFGFHNPDQFQFIVSGDERIGYASNTKNGDSSSLIAAQLNLDFDLRLTSTERFHWFITPLTQGANSTRWLMDDDQFESEFNSDILFGYFEGDLGAIAGGTTDKTLPFDMPFSVGVMPLVIQNGVWMDDTILGIAATLPAQNMPFLNIPNIDLTFLFGMDQINSPAFQNDNNAAKIYAIMAFIEASGGYVEADYAFLEDRDAVLDRSYHNISISYTRRYGFISNSTRVLANAGQSTDGPSNTADGVLLLSENSLITWAPYNIVPYLNLFAGFDRPQSAARQAAAGGVLRNTGILFESDNLTGYPTLDATANDTFGMAIGMNMLPPDFTHQLVLESAFLGTMGVDATRNVAGNQYGVGARYQVPLSNHSLIRFDAMYGACDNASDVRGARIEYRHKF